MSDVSSTLTAHLALEGDTCQLRFLVCFAATVLAITMDWLSLSGTSDRLRLSITGFSLSSPLFPDISKTYRKQKTSLLSKTSHRVSLTSLYWSLYRHVRRFVPKFTHKLLVLAAGAPGGEEELIIGARFLFASGPRTCFVVHQEEINEKLHDFLR